MLGSVITEALKSLLLFALHVENTNVFPKPLTRKEEEECFRLMNEENSIVNTVKGQFNGTKVTV